MSGSCLSSSLHPLEIGWRRQGVSSAARSINTFMFVYHDPCSVLGFRVDLDAIAFRSKSATNLCMISMSIRPLDVHLRDQAS